MTRLPIVRIAKLAVMPLAMPLLIALGIAVALAAPRDATATAVPQASAHVVTRLGDPAPFNGLSNVSCALREALIAANPNPGTILALSSVTYLLIIASTNEDAARRATSTQSSAPQMSADGDREDIQ